MKINDITKYSICFFVFMFVNLSLQVKEYNISDYGAVNDGKTINSL